MSTLMEAEGLLKAVIFGRLLARRMLGSLVIQKPWKSGLCAPGVKKIVLFYSSSARLGVHYRAAKEILWMDVTWKDAFLFYSLGRHLQAGGGGKALGNGIIQKGRAVSSDVIVC